MPKIKRTLTRDMPNGSRYVADVELRLAAEGSRFDETGLSPGFSLTGEVYERRSNARGAARQKRGLDPDYSGAIGDELARVFPKLAPIAALHLSDPDGTPMHAEENGWYWYAGSRVDITAPKYTGFSSIYPHQLAERGLPDTDEGRREYCYRVACKMLRVDEISLAVERERKDPAPAYGGEWTEPIDAFTTRVRVAFSEFVDAQRERWAQEAADARALIESLPTEEEG